MSFVVIQDHENQFREQSTGSSVPCGWEVRQVSQAKGGAGGRGESGINPKIRILGPVLLTNRDCTVSSQFFVHGDIF